MIAADREFIGACTQMIENLETLVVLSKTGTMMESATVLKISQSAVSKRIDALERYYDRELIERHGRRVVLTHHGTRLVERVMPLISELRGVFLEDNALRKGKIIMGVSEAILASWGPRLFAMVQARMPEVEFTFHAQRSPVVLDRIRSGEYMLGICTGSPDADTDLLSEVIRLEPETPSGYLARGFVYADLRRDKEAEEDFGAACRLGSRDGCIFASE